MRFGSNEDINCMKILERALDCATPRHQFTEYYRTGDIDHCRGTYSDFTLCLRAKSKSHAEATQMLKGTRLDTSVKPCPTADIWPLKERPCWSSAGAAQSATSAGESK